MSELRQGKTHGLHCQTKHNSKTRGGGWGGCIHYTEKERQNSKGGKKENTTVVGVEIVHAKKNCEFGSNTYIPTAACLLARPPRKKKSRALLKKITLFNTEKARAYNCCLSVPPGTTDIRNRILFAHFLHAVLKRRRKTRELPGRAWAPSDRPQRRPRGHRSQTHVTEKRLTSPQSEKSTSASTARDNQG